MIELTVKTLDSKNHSFSVPDDLTVKQLKERIAESISIPADSQRLIYCGRVLQDEKNLSEYDVNGKVIHLVQRAPPGASSGSSTSTRSTTSTTGSRRNQQWRNFFGHGANSGNAMYLGAMAFPAEIVDLSAMRQPRQCLSQSRLDVVRSMLQRASTILNRLENPSLETTDPPAENSSEPSGTANNDEVPVATIAPVLPAALMPESFVIDGQHIEPVNGGTSEVPSNNTSEQNSESPEGETQAAGATNGQQPPENEEEADESSAQSRYPRTTALADLMDQAAEINTRVQPFMSQYQQLMRDDPSFTDQVAVTTNQRLFTNVSEIMHNLAHAYHALSDIMCDFSQRPPRQLRCRPVLIQHSAVVQTGIPIQVSSGANGNAGQQNNSSGGTATANEDQPPVEPPVDDTATAPATAPSVDPILEPSPPPTQVPEPPVEWAEMARQQEASANPRPPPVRFTRVEGPPGLEVFVDVGPGSITIDSVETTVVTNASGNPSEQNTWQNPPEFVQNLLTAVADQLMAAPGLPPGLAPVSVSVATTASSATPASSTSTSAPSQASASNGQAPPGAATGAQNSQARGNTATHPTTATQTRSTPRPHVHLSPSINGLRTNNFDPFLPCNSHHIRSSRAGRQRTAQAQADNPPQPRVMTLTPPSTISISVRAGRDMMNNYIGNIPNATRAPTEGSAQSRLAAEFQRFMQERRNPETASTTTTPTTTTPDQPYPPQIAHLLQAIQNADGPATLAQVLENVPGYSYTPGENILTDIFMTLAQSLSFLDVVQLGLGSSECLVRARPLLQQLISQRLLNNEPLTLPASRQIIDKFNTELTPHYSIFESARMREEIDLLASINVYNHYSIPGILHTIMNEDPSTFHRSLLQKSISYVRYLCAIIHYCCLDGETGLESVIRATVEQMTTGIPDALQEWTMSHSIMNFRTFLSSINSDLMEIERFIVFRGTRHPGCSQASTTGATAPAAEPMDTHDLNDLEAPNSAVILNSEWQNPLPSDWVPIITRDSQRQRRQNTQGPFSDAYMSGMPSKRRKLITSAKPQGNLSQVISESMATALGAAGMSTGPEVDVIAMRAGEDTQLRSAYREQIRSTLHYNLNANPDYLPEKYPNTTKYLKK